MNQKAGPTGDFPRGKATPHDKRLERIANQLFDLLQKFGNIPCPMCGAKLKLEDETFVCKNPASPAESTHRVAKPCPFRAPMSYFLDEETEQKKSA